MAANSIAFKSSVRLHHAHSQMLDTFNALLLTAPSLHLDTVVITSASDSHGPASLHSKDLAWDIRTHPTSLTSPRLGGILAASYSELDELATEWVKHLYNVLGPNYDILYERELKHIHVEYDPKYASPTTIQLHRGTTMSKFKELFSGKKTYLVSAGIAVLVLLDHNSGTLDLNALVTDPDLILKELGVALIATFRDALAKIGK